MNAVEQLVVARDMGKRARCGRHVAHLERGFDWSIHHRRPRGSGGTSIAWVNQPANLIVLCGSGTTGCHGSVERDRKHAFDEGLLVSKIGVATAMNTRLKHALHGWVLLDNEGGYEAAEDYGKGWAEL